MIGQRGPVEERADAARQPRNTLTARGRDLPPGNYSRPAASMIWRAGPLAAAAASASGLRRGRNPVGRPARPPATGIGASCRLRARLASHVQRVAARARGELVTAGYFDTLQAQQRKRIAKAHRRRHTRASRPVALINESRFARTHFPRPGSGRPPDAACRRRPGSKEPWLTDDRRRGAGPHHGRHRRNNNASPVGYYIPISAKRCGQRRSDRPFARVVNRRRLPRSSAPR